MASGENMSRANTVNRANNHVNVAGIVADAVNVVSVELDIHDNAVSIGDVLAMFIMMDSMCMLQKRTLSIASALGNPANVYGDRAFLRDCADVVGSMQARLAGTCCS